MTEGRAVAIVALDGRIAVARWLFAPAGSTARGWFGRPCAVQADAREIGEAVANALRERNPLVDDSTRGAREAFRAIRRAVAAGAGSEPARVEVYWFPPDPPIASYMREVGRGYVGEAGVPVPAFESPIAAGDAIMALLRPDKRSGL